MGNSCSSQYRSIGNLYHKTIKVKFDVQRPFTETKELEGRGNVEVGPMAIGGGGRKLTKESWSKVEVLYTSVKPGHFIKGKAASKGETFLTVVTEDKQINVNTWQVETHTSWLITKRGELKRADDENPLKVHQDDAATQNRDMQAVGNNSDKGRDDGPSSAVEHKIINKRRFPRQPVAEKLRYFEIKTEYDQKDCHICGMGVTYMGTLLLIDRNNKNIKSFSKDNKFLSVLPLSGEPRCITIVNRDVDAVVAGLRNETLYVINVSQPALLSLRKTIKLEYNVRAITDTGHGTCTAICETDPVCVKQICYEDGRENWSTSTDRKGNALFTWSFAIACEGVSCSLPTVAAVSYNGTAITLMGLTGEHIKTKKVEKKWFRGITRDEVGYWYLNCLKTREIYVMRSFDESGVLLSSAEIKGNPKAIVFHDKTKRLYVSYEDMNIIDCFKIIYK